MKTKEFMAKVRSLEFGIIQEGHQLVIRTPGCSVVARVNRPSQQTEILQFTFGSADRIELLNIISEYTGTPPAEREEEKRYYLKCVAPPIIERQISEYLTYSKYISQYAIGLSTNPWDENIQAIFTESEIAAMDITGFEKVEVVE